MKPDDPDPRPTRTFTSGDEAEVVADHTRTFSADPSATSGFPISVPAPLKGPISGWPAGLTRYEPLHALGGGGMGIVYLCHDRQLDRQVAVKLSGLGRSASQDRIDFALREARSAARLHHPNICPVFDADVCDGVPYLTMAYVDGPTLADELKRCGPCPPTAAAKLVRAIAEAMQYAHDQGVVHRDLKPSNILLTPEREPIVTDFGLAVRTDRDTTASGSISGTPHYMAPEQAAGDTANIGERTDIFSLGVILFETLTGKVPFDGSAHEVMAKVQRQSLPPVRKVHKGVPKVLERIVAKATARKPDDRYQTMTALSDALSDYLRELRPKRKPNLLFWFAVGPSGVILGAALLCCGLGVVLPAIQRVRDAANRSQTTRMTELVGVTDDRAKRARNVWTEGEEFANQKKYDEALARFDEAISLDSAAERPRVLRAEVYTHVGRHKDALAEYNTLLRWKPDSEDWLFRRAEVQIRLKEYPDALMDLNKLIREKSTNVPALVASGAIRIALNEFEQAKVDLTRAVLFDPKNAAALYLRGMAKLLLVDERGSVEDLAAATAIDPEIEAKVRANGYFDR